MAAFTNENNHFHSPTIDYQQQMILPWESLAGELPLPSSPAEKARSATSEYRWSNDPLFSLQAPFDTDSSDTEFSEEYCPFYPLPPGEPSDKSVNTLSGPASYSTDVPRSWPFASNRFSDQRAYTPTSDQEETQSEISDKDSTHPASDGGRLLEEVRVVHNQVEQRYRHRVRDNINALWNVIPECPGTIQPSKAVILKRAKDHILELQQHARREKRERETLEAKVQMLQHFLAERPGTKETMAQNINYSAV